MLPFSFPVHTPTVTPLSGPLGEDSCWEQLVSGTVVGLGKWQEEETLPPHPHSLNLQQTHTFLIKFLVLAAHQAQLLKELLMPVKGPW